MARPKFPEFVALMAALMSLGALTIDAMLPALGEIGTDLGVERENDVQLIVALYFLGFSSGQLFYGPLSDSVGRKRALLVGLGVYMVGCLLSLFGATFSAMLGGRLLQGLGVCAGRIVSMAIIRDQYQGRQMARVMSFAMAVFIIVPIIAPSLGQAILLFIDWRGIFVAFLALALAASLWFLLRQPETLPEDKRLAFTFSRIWLGFGEVLKNRVAFGYTVVAGLAFGGFLAYLSSAQQIFQVQYGLGAKFPLYFAGLSLSLGVASLSNTQLVMRFGMKPLARAALVGLAVLSAGFFVAAQAAEGQPPLWSLVVYLSLVFFCQGVLYGNVNSIAMEPLGHIAGIGAAVIGALSMGISIGAGTWIGQSYDGTVLPLVLGFGVLGVLGLGAMFWTERSWAVES